MGSQLQLPMNFKLKKCRKKNNTISDQSIYYCNNHATWFLSFIYIYIFQLVYPFHRPEDIKFISSSKKKSSSRSKRNERILFPFYFQIQQYPRGRGFTFKEQGEKNRHHTTLQCALHIIQKIIHPSIGTQNSCVKGHSTPSPCLSLGKFTNP